MEHNFCGTMWSTYKVKNNQRYDGRRHGCRFPKGHKGNICMCVCGKAHRNLDTESQPKKEASDALVHV